VRACARARRVRIGVADQSRNSGHRGRERHDEDFSVRGIHVLRALRWLAARWSDSTDYRFDLVAADVSGDMAYLVGFEHVANSVVGVPVEPYTLRVTHIFRREAGEWKIAHRHADYVPIDQTLPGHASSA
jgi:SnoaL-like domain